MKLYIIGLCTFIVCLIGLNSAMTFAMIEVAKESKVDGDVMISKATGDPIQVANNEYTAANGRLTVREGIANTSSSSSSGGVSRKLLSMYDGSNTLVTVSAEAAEHEVKLKSCMPNSYFSKMKQFIIKKGAVYMELNVLGFVRQPRGNSFYGTVVVIITHIGRITIDGETLSYVDDIGHMFAEAGFDVELSSRRLLGTLEMIAILNAVPAEAYECYDPVVDGPKPVFPDDFAVYTRSYQNCRTSAGENLCANVTNARLADLVEIEGYTFAKAEGYQIISSTHQYSMETWAFPSRTDKYMVIDVRTIFDPLEWPDMESSVRYMTELKSLNTIGDLMAAVHTGYYCEDQYSNITQRNGKDVHSLLVKNCEFSHLFTIFYSFIFLLLYYGMVV